MSEKKEMIKAGQDVSVDDNVIVLNSVSVAEKQEVKEETLPVIEPVVEQETKETDVTTSEEPVIPALIPEEKTTIEQGELPEFNFPTPENSDVPVFPVEPVLDVQALNEDKVSDFPQIPIANEAFVPTPESNVEISVPSYSPFEENNIEYESKSEEPSNVYNFSDFANNEQQNNFANESKLDFSVSGVYKSTSDVDSAKQSFLKDVENAYDKNISAPTKTLVSLLNDFKNWGNKVTSQGLNRPLFEEFDDLSARYDGMKVASYGDDNDVTFDFGSSSYNDEDNGNNYGGMVA